MHAFGGRKYRVFSLAKYVQQTNQKGYAVKKMKLFGTIMSEQWAQKHVFSTEIHEPFFKLIFLRKSFSVPILWFAT